MKVIIRKMVASDSSEWAQMRYRMWDSLSVSEHLGDIAKMLTGRIKSTGYVAISDGSFAGFAEVSIRDYANGCTVQPVPFLEGIWVNPEYRQQEIGRKFIAEIERDLVTQSFNELCSDAHIENDISHHAHNRWGFEETDRVVYFRKPLDNCNDPQAKPVLDMESFPGEGVG